ncbi:B-box zinc finger protein 22-like [Oryza glaberrima]|uniref:B-box zinc finger protein 22-like n=1 Tax=Oryza glaberrima TaxID=4538 RepID=UPI00224C59CF|nr:B-box zinc finger protein 22-like [Oryza glaberrima]
MSPPPPPYYHHLLLRSSPTTTGGGARVLAAAELARMKLLCSACEAAEASVLCCADEAALCARCDRDIHAANRLAGKHLRLPLLSPASSSSSAAAALAPPPPSPPKCDICQESHAYFFCLEDRALLCRSCDVAVHTANAFVSAHRRFLLTGVQVGQEQDEHSPDPPEPSPPPPPPPPAAKSDHPAPLYGEGGGGFSWDAADSPAAGGLPDWSAVDDQFGSPPPPRHTDTATVTTPPPPPPTKRSPRAPAFGGQGGMMDWPLGEFFGGFTDFTGGFGFGFGDSGTSKADSGKLGGSTDGSPYYRSSSEDDRNADELFGQVPEIQWSVPELPSPPTASGLHWQRHPAAAHGGGDGGPDTTAFVPDICSPDSCFPATTSKRRRQ